MEAERLGGTWGESQSLIPSVPLPPRSLSRPFPTLDALPIESFLISEVIFQYWFNTTVFRKKLQTS